MTTTAAFAAGFVIGILATLAAVVAIAVFNLLAHDYELDVARALGTEPTDTSSTGAFVEQLDEWRTGRD